MRYPTPFVLTLSVVLGVPCLGADAGLGLYHEALRDLRDRKYDDAFERLKSVVGSNPEFERAYGRIAQVCSRSTGRAPQAEAFLRSLPDPYRHYGLAVWHRQLKQADLAADHARQAAEQRPAWIAPYVELVNTERDRGRQEELLRWLNLQASGAGVSFAVGLLHYQRGEHAKARPLLEQAHNLSDFSWEIENTRYLVEYMSDQPVKAQAIVQAMLDRAVATGDFEWQGRLLCRMGVLDRDLGRNTLAGTRIRQSLPILRDLGESAAEQSCQSNLGSVYVLQGRYAEAVAEIEQALALSRSLGDRMSEGRNLGLIANIHAETGNYPKAVHAFESATTIARETGDRPSEADQLASVSLVHTALGAHGKARQSVAKALRIAKEEKNPWLEGRFLEIQGLIDRNLRRHQDALASLSRGLRLAEQLGDKFGEGARLVYIGEIHALGGRYALAQEILERALQIAQSAGTRLVEAYAHNDLGRVHLYRGNIRQARRCYEEAAAIAIETRAPEVAWRAQSGLAETFRRVSLNQQAAEYYRKSVETIERLRSSLGLTEDKAGFLENKIEVYRQWARLLLDSDIPQAFEVTERGRARALLDLLAEARWMGQHGLPEAIAERRRLIEGHLSRLQHDIRTESGKRPVDRQKLLRLQDEWSETDSAYESLRREIRNSSPRYADLQYPEPARLADIQASLGAEEAILEYSLGARGSTLFVIGRGGVAAFRLESAPRIEARVRALRESGAVQPSRTSWARYVQEARALHQILIAPANSALRGKTRIVIVPDGSLHYLPFALLLESGVAGADDLTRLPYLIRRYVVSYAPSASVYLSLGRHRDETKDPGRKIVLVADPAYGVRLPRLTDSRREARGIARSFPGRARVLLDAEASEENVKALDAIDGVGVLHFAAHGVLNEARPQYSGLELSSSRSGIEDGTLQAFEIANLRTSARLVVLSACNTGLGRAVNGEGLTGLTQAFLTAGASAVLASLWRVEDESTAALMIAFYRGMARSNLAAAEALRQAQLDAIRTGRFSHPYYWSAFVLTGAAPALRIQ